MSNKVSIHIKGNTERRGEPQEVRKVIGGRYSVEKELGRGGIGEVSLAQDLQLERMVAVKRILVQMGSSAQRAQFAIDEAKRLARLQHPNIVTVFDVLDDAGDLLMVMEYLSGYTLGDLQSPLTLEDFINVARQSLSGLAAAHALGMIHLDIKSTNIMLTWLATGQLQVKILDFGLATMLGQATADSEDGSVLGSIYTMAPEQLLREPVDVRTDLYSLGCVFYHALTGKDPFRGATVEEIMNAHLQHDFRPLTDRRPDLPLAVSSWVENLMSKDPADRPTDATSALKALVSALSAGKSGSDIKNLRSGSRDGGAEQVEEITLPATAQLQACLGRSAAVHGVVERVWENMPGTVRFLNFETVQHSEFSVVLILKENHPEFAKEQLNTLIGKKIRVTGKITDFHGSPQVVVESPSQIAHA